MTGNRSAILTYHSLDNFGSVISISPALFRRHMELLAQSGIPVVPLDEALGRSGAVALTFDDGYANFAEHAVPVLEHFDFPATVFVVADYAGRTSDWPSLPYAKAPPLPLLGWGELAALPPAISVGAHSRTHPDLTRLPAGRCEEELRGSRERLQQRLGRPVRWFAYPYGTSSPAVRTMAQRHFELAVGSSLRFLHPGADRMDLPRIETYYLRGAFPLEKLFTAGGRVYIAFRRLLRDLRHAAA